MNPIDTYKQEVKDAEAALVKAREKLEEAERGGGRVGKVGFTQQFKHPMDGVVSKPDAVSISTNGNITFDGCAYLPEHVNRLIGALLLPGAERDETEVEDVYDWDMVLSGGEVSVTYNGESGHLCYLNEEACLTALRLIALHKLRNGIDYTEITD